MFRWCSYCQKFIGESPPFTDFSWTDGICGSCLARGAFQTQRMDARFRKRFLFFRSIREMAFKGQSIDYRSVLKRATHFGVSPADALIGVLQPILCEIGDLFEVGKISPVEEHLFSALMEKILNHFEAGVEMRLRTSREEVVLACAEGNYHSIGIRMLSFLLAERGVRSRVLVPGVPAGDLVRLCEKLKPRILGISVYEVGQLGYIDKIQSCFRTEPPGLIAVGGSFLKGNSVKVASSIFVPDPRDTKGIVERFKAECGNS